MASNEIRVLIVDDHTVIRRGVAALLSTEAGIVVVGEAGDGAEAVARAGELTPDVILMDLVMPGMDGVEAIRAIRRHQKDARVLVLTSFGSDNKLFPAIKAGALGFLLKDASPEELIRSIRRVAAGDSALNPSVARRILNEFSRDPREASPAELLTDREQEVLRELAKGRSNDSIAGVLFISEATVRTHVSSILSKLQLENRTQAALYALKAGLASLDEIEDPATGE